MATGQHRASRDIDAPATEAVEDYAKAIYALAQRGEGAVGTSALAERLGVSPASVTAMLKRMDAMKLVTREPYRGVTLTPAGEKVALEVMRHHRLLEAYLSEALGMPWDRVHDEAEVLEHYISEELEERIATALGDPNRDPLLVAEQGIRPGAELRVTERQPFGGPLFVEVEGARHAIGGDLAQRMLIT